MKISNSMALSRVTSRNRNYLRKDNSNISNNMLYNQSFTGISEKVHLSPTAKKTGLLLAVLAAVTAPLAPQSSFLNAAGGVKTAVNAPPLVSKHNEDREGFKTLDLFNSATKTRNDFWGSLSGGNRQNALFFEDALINYVAGYKDKKVDPPMLSLEDVEGLAAVYEKKTAQPFNRELGVKQLLMYTELSKNNDASLDEAAFALMSPEKEKTLKKVTAAVDKWVNESDNLPEPDDYSCSSLKEECGISKDTDQATAIIFNMSYKRVDGSRIVTWLNRHPNKSVADVPYENYLQRDSRKSQAELDKRIKEMVKGTILEGYY